LNFQGLESKLDYFKELGAETLCLRGNIINKESPKSFLGKFETSPHKAFKKSIKQRDMHLIMDIPFEILQSQVYFLRTVFYKLYLR
jgi:hypothetical protein